MRRVAGGWLLAVVASVALAAPAAGQTRLPRATGGLEAERERAPLPEYPEPAPPPELELPPRVPAPDLAPEAGLAETGIVVRGFRIEGNSVLDEAALAAAVAPFLDRRLRAEQLALVTDAITRLYVESGYVGSGAFVPDQTVEDGLLTVRVIEGHVAALEIETSGRLRNGWVETRLRRALRAPLRLDRLDEGLRLLQQDPRVARVDAVVVPMPRRGQARVRIEVEEADPLSLEARVANDLAPALGGWRATADAVHRNVTGFGDRLALSVTGARGLFDLDVEYRLPISPWQTELELGGGLARGEVVEGDFAEGDFADLDFRNELDGARIALRQPLWRSLEDEVALVVGVERRASDVTFDTNEDLFQRERLYLLRIDADWVRRTLDQVVALRLRGTFGFDVWDATSPTPTPGAPTLADGRFRSVFLQLQHARRIRSPIGPLEWVARGDLQLASGSLPSLEAFSMGGASTVRGYHENVVVTDNGVLGALELRVPISPDAWRPHALRVAPFVDAGYAWDDGDDDAASFDRVYASAGLGLLYRYGDRFDLRAWYGEAFVLDPNRSPRGEALQDRGLHVEARILLR